MKESAVIGEKKQSPLKGKICRPHFPSSWEPGQRCDNVPNRERETVRAERKEDERRDKWRENGAFCLIMFEGRTESPEQSYREKLNIFMNLFSLSSLAAAGGSYHVTLDWLAGWLGGGGGHLHLRETRASSLHFPPPSRLQHNHSSC